MVWLWKRKPTAHDGTSTTMATAETAVEDAVATSQRQDKEWRRQAARLRQEEKRREKEVAKQAKRELALMKKQARAARKAQAKAQKLAKKQAKAVRKVQKRELKIVRKRAKTIAKLRRSNEKRRKRMLRKRQKEERRRRKRVQVQTVQPLEPEVAVAAAGSQALATTLPLEPPVFKEDKRCKSCHSQFSRLPMRRRHHCRNCGESICSKCLSATKRPIPWFQLDKPQKVCFSCDVQVFNGVGGATSNSGSGDSSAAVTTSPPASTTLRSEASPVQPPLATHDSPVRVQRSASFQSEQPEDSPRTASPPSSARSGLTFRLRSRSTQRAGTIAPPKTKKSSRWTLPIRPLLKRKASADQLRNRTWDLDLRIEKEEMLARQRQSQMVQFASAS
jgi:hypothetical protein